MITRTRSLISSINAPLIGIIIKEESNILIIGNFFDNKEGRPTSQAEILLHLLRTNGFKAKGVSKYLRAIPRFIDQMFNLVVHRLKKSYKIVIIEFYGSKAFYLQAINICLSKLLSYKVIVNLHGGSIPERYEKSTFLANLCFRKADLIKAPSEYLQKFVESKGYRCLLVENIIDLSEYVIPQKEKFGPRILWMRAFQAVYDPATALKTFQLFLEEEPDARMTMAGSDLGQLASTKRLAEELGLNERVTFPGYLDHEQKIALAEQCDVYLCTNRIDNTPVSLVEMMALGLVIVSTNPGGIPDLVKDKETALLSEVGDAQGLCENLRFVINNQSAVSEMVEKAKEQAKRFDAKEVALKWRDALNALNAGRN